MSGEQEAFATDVDLMIDGDEVDDGEIISLMIERDLDQPDMCAVVLRNDHGDNSNKYSMADAVEIQVSKPDDLNSKESVFKGEIVAIEVQSKAGGDSKVVIRAFNKMHRMLRGKKSKTYVSMSDQDIVSQVAGNSGLSADSGSDPTITHDHVYQHNQTDLEFVRVRAARLGFNVWCKDTTLYFKKPDPGEDSGIELKIEEPGEHHLKSFHARLSSANVVNKVTVRGWDPKKKEEIVYEASPSGTRLGSTQAHSASGDLGQAVTYTVDHPIFSVAEAQAIAKAKLDEHLMSYITGEAECRGHFAYDLGMVVTITVNGDKPDDRFNGKYMIRGVTHKYTHGQGGGGTGGFVSILRVQRDAEKP